MILVNAMVNEGLVILITGMTIVFLALVLLFVVFQVIIPAIMKKKPIPFKKTTKDENTEASSSESGEEMAAICTAIYLFLEETHDEENAILTIGKSVKDYSPWSSKIYVTHRLNTR